MEENDVINHIVEVVVLRGDEVVRTSDIALMLLLCRGLVHKLRWKVDSLDYRGVLITREVVHKYIYEVLEELILAQNKSFMDVKGGDEQHHILNSTAITSSLPTTSSSSLVHGSGSGVNMQVALKQSRICYISEVSKGGKKRKQPEEYMEVVAGNSLVFGNCQRVKDLERNKRGKFVGLDGVAECHAVISCTAERPLLYNFVGDARVKINGKGVATTTDMQSPHHLAHDALVSICGFSSEATFKIGGNIPLPPPHTSLCVTF